MNQDLVALKSQGRLVPAFHDTHMHLVEYGKFLSLEDLRTMTSIDHLVDHLKKTCPQGKIEAFGWNQNAWSDHREPNRLDLDRIATDRPIILSRVCGHVTVVNTYVVKALGLFDEVPTIEGGHIDCDERGLPTGMLREKARVLLYQAGYYDESKASIKAYILKAQADLLSKGITVVHSDDLSMAPNLSWQTILDAFLELERENLLKIKVVSQANVKDLAGLKATKDKLMSKKISIGSVKIFTDGSLGARTAHLSLPYEDEPTTCGLALQTDQALLDQVKEAYTFDLPLSVHAIGDQAIDRVLRALEALNAPKTYLEACGIIHCQITRTDLLKRMQSLGIRAYIQPIFLHEDAKMVVDRLGEKRAQEAYVWATMHKMGIPLYMGSDAPIETPDVIKGLYCALTRQTLDEKPLTYLKDQALSLEVALRAYRGNQDHDQGWLLLENPLDQCIKTPHHNPILGVMVEGDWVYKKV